MASTTSGMTWSSPPEDRLISRRQLVRASTLARLPGSLDAPSSLFDTFKFTPVTFGFTDRPSSKALFEERMEREEGRREEGWREEGRREEGRREEGRREEGWREEGRREEGRREEETSDLFNNTHRKPRRGSMLDDQAKITHQE